MQEILNLIQSFEPLLKLIGGLTAFILFVISFKRYKKDQQWKKKEFVAKEMKDFYENKMNKSAMQMLDWGNRKIELYPDHPQYEKRFATVDRKALAKAMLPHKWVVGSFTEDEAVIRDIFDHFFSGLTRVHHFIEAKLVTTEDFKPYLRYWINNIANDMPSLPRNVLQHFIIHYKYHEVLSLFEKFDMKIEPQLDQAAILNQLKELQSR